VQVSVNPCTVRALPVRDNLVRFMLGQNNYVTTLPPLSAPCAADEVAAATEAGSRAESFVIVNGSDLRKASVAVMSVRSWRSTGLRLVWASHGPDDFK